MKFLNVEIDKLIKEHGVFSCIDCEKCISSCPLSRTGADFSPRFIIEKVLLGLDFVEDKQLWFCLTCEACAKRCPSNVRLAKFVESVRLVALNQGITDYILLCKRCGKHFTTTPILEHAKKSGGLNDLKEELMLYCPKCKKRVLAETPGVGHGFERGRALAVH